MNKLLMLYNRYILKVGVAFAILFTALYPKLPSIQVTNTWVYIRLEDFLIAILTAIWLIKIARKEIKLPFPIASPILLYWFAGLCSLIFSLIFIGPHIANFFPKIAALQYLRRIEYMILFFIALSTIKGEKDILDYIKIIFATAVGIVIYGFGQRWYINLWQLYPKFFEKNPFCFPSFQTGNEEFAKGIPLCLPSDARITSTFGGHYDLAAYLVVLIPILFGAFFAFKNIFAKLFALIISISSLMLLILTSSRVSFMAYLFSIVTMLIISRQKKYILPVVLFSLILLFSFSQSTARRFLETVRIASVVTNNQNQVVGVTESSLPKVLQKKISKSPAPVIVAAPPPSQNLPVGSSFITLPNNNNNVESNTTTVAVVKTVVPADVVKKLNLAYGGEQLSTISGTFLVQKALVYDISFTTRFQSEWPNAWNAFMRNPILGSGYSSITLASDSDYFRTLGETGVLGFFTFALIFMFLGILLTQMQKQRVPAIANLFAAGVGGGVMGLFINASFIDVFEASKVAEGLWLFLGIGAGGLLVYQKEKIDYKAGLKNIFTSNVMVYIYLLILTGIVFLPSISNFFVADDFTWLRWAGESSIQSLKRYFTDSYGFFYRPIDKFIVFALFSIGAFNPETYHIFILALHFLTAFGVYLLLKRLFNSKFWAFFGAVLFLVLPAHGENVYWFATISTTLSTLLIVYTLLAWIYFREKSILGYFGSLIFIAISLFTYEMSIIIPGLLVLTDIVISKPKKIFTASFYYIPIGLLIVIYLFLRKNSHSFTYGGDYAYNVVHFIPNFAGNLLGYVGIFLSGEYFSPVYISMRTNLRVYSFQIYIALVILLMVIILISFIKRRKLLSWIKQPSDGNLTYGFLFAIIALLPFIGLGNISERYVYLASAGMIIVFISLLKGVYKVFANYNLLVTRIIGFALILIFLVWNAFTVIQESAQWKRSGEITRNTLNLLHMNFPSFNPQSHVFFVNVPIRYHNAWTFPVGLPDAIWFIYRSSSPKIYEAKTLADAKNMAKDLEKDTPNFTKHIFLFDKNFNLSEIQ